MTLPAFTDSEELRLLLIQLRVTGPNAWREDPDAAELMRFVMGKYAALAHRHQQTPADAAVAAFEAMRTQAVILAQDPWAAVTRAVQITMIAEERAQGLLCETRKARTRAVAGLHDAERFGDRDTPICDFHPAFHVPAEQVLESGDSTDTVTPGRTEQSTSAEVAVERAVTVFTTLGWPEDTARSSLSFICARLVQLGNRPSTFESLRRDPQARVLLDLDQAAWLALLRAVLGNPDPDRVHTDGGRGLLLRLVLGEHPCDLVADPGLADLIQTAAPGFTGARHG